MKRPFDIGTFPKNQEIKTFHNLDFRKSRFYCAIETVEPVSKENVYNFELKEITEYELNKKGWI
jgi:hypothetical protein